MIIRKYGITLSRLRRPDIELVREKRNSASIREKMIFQKMISADMQEKWFSETDTMFNNYFLIESKNKKIGLVNGKNINFSEKSSEGGIFIWEQNDPLVPALCSVIMNDYTFLINDFNCSYIKILKSNASAISYNRMMGYEPATNKKSEKQYFWFVLTKENYLRKIKPYRRGIELLTGDAAPLSPADFSFMGTSDEEIVRLYGGLPGNLKQNINKVLLRENRKLI
jgi:hypothetical protein